MQSHSTANRSLPAIDLPAIDLPAMLATLGSYDHLFGPRHIQTLSLAVRIAEVLRHLGESQTARLLLERVVRDLNQSSNRAHATRIVALHALCAVLIEQSQLPKAIAVQQELAECWQLVCGPHAPETIAAKAHLETLLMSSPEDTFEA
jgi:hypothetical protein